MERSQAHLGYFSYATIRFACNNSTALFKRRCDGKTYGQSYACIKTQWHRKQSMPLDDLLFYSFCRCCFLVHFHFSYIVKRIEKQPENENRKVFSNVQCIWNISNGVSYAVFPNRTFFICAIFAEKSIFTVEWQTQEIQTKKITRYKNLNEHQNTEP